jgi:hypothetical protein
MTSENVPAGTDQQPQRDEARREAGDRLCELIIQLDSLTALIMGDGFENFKNHSDEIQDNVLWLINDLSSQIKSLHAVAYGGAQ